MKLFKIYIRYIFKRVVFLLYLLFFVLLYFVLDANYLTLFALKIPNPFYEFFAAQTRFFYIILIFIIFAFTSTIVEILLTIKTSKKQNKIDGRRMDIYNDLNSKIYKHLFETNEVDSDIYFVQDIKNLYKDDYPRIVFIDRVRRIAALTKGSIYARCVRMFHLLNEEELIRTYLNAPLLRYRILSIRLIGDLKLKAFLPDLKQLMYHKNEVIASEAMYAYVKTDTSTNLLFLIERNRAISRLDFYNFLKITLNYKNIDYRALITCHIPSVSALGLRFANRLQLKSEKGEIFRRINHNDQFVSQEAQAAYISMIEEYDAPILINRFDAFNKDNQKTILAILGEYLKNPIVLSLFSNIIEQFDYDIKTAALGVLMQNNITESLKFRNHPDPLVQKAFSELTHF